MKIEKVEIKGLFGKKDICWELNPQVNVLVGANGSGKSTILSIVYSFLTQTVPDGVNNIITHASIRFPNGQIELETMLDVLEMIKKHVGDDGKIEDFIINSLELHDELQDDNTELKILFSGFKVVDNKPLTEITKNKLSSYIYFDLIEANLTNSNANHIIQKSNQEKTNALDMEIRETIYEFNKIKTDELIERLLSSLNLFFNQIGKHVSYENDELVYTDIKLQKQLNYSHLSSGERQLIYIFLRVALSNADKNKTAIILMDEPEISLHLDWQEHFIKQLTLLNPDAQFIIVTHSPALIMNGWNDVYTDMEEITTWL